MSVKKVDPWTIIQYPIHANVCGEIHQDIPGLGYHSEIDLWVTGLSGGREWVVDHLASGAAIARFTAQARARVCIEQIAPLLNWTLPLEELRQQPELIWKQVRKAIDFASDWKPEEARKLLQLRQQVSIWTADTAYNQECPD